MVAGIVAGLGLGARSSLRSLETSHGAGKPASVAPAVRATGPVGGTERKVRTLLGRIPGERRGRAGLAGRKAAGRSTPRSSRGTAGQAAVTDSATENIPPVRRAVSPRARARVKRWGKSPPRRPRGRRQGKPNPVQDKIGDWAARPRVPGMSHPPARLRRSGGRFPRGSREKWRSLRRRPKDRIRLTAPRPRPSSAQKSNSVACRLRLLAVESCKG